MVQYTHYASCLNVCVSCTLLFYFMQHQHLNDGEYYYYMSQLLVITTQGMIMNQSTHEPLISSESEINILGVRSWLRALKYEISVWKEVLTLST